MGPLGPLRRNVGENYKGFTILFKNGVRETAVRVHIGAQNNVKHDVFYEVLMHSEVFWLSFVFSLRILRVFCISSVSLTLRIRIFAAYPLCFLHFKRFADPENSNSRCGSITKSVFWKGKFAFSLRFYREFCVLTCQIRILATVL